MSHPRHLHAVNSAAGRLDRSAVLTAGLPAVFAGTAFDPSDPALAGVCTTGRILVLRTRGLPVPMQREISWWVAACHADGERVINTCDWNRWAATAAEVAGERPRVSSFADLSLAEWTAAWARKFHADNGRLASASTRYRAECAIRGLLRRLAIQYSDAPWWTYDVWCLRFDPRIPRREHEPRGESTVCWDDIQPRWVSGKDLTASERRAAALRQAAQAKRQAAVARADTAIRQLIKDDEQWDASFFPDCGSL